MFLGKIVSVRVYGAGGYLIQGIPEVWQGRRRIGMVSGFIAFEIDTLDSVSMGICGVWSRE